MMKLILVNVANIKYLFWSYELFLNAFSTRVLANIPAYRKKYLISFAELSFHYFHCNFVVEQFLLLGIYTEYLNT